jgi:UDP-N-acetylglucosamine 2-epimerase (non-hydrolysing)
MAKSVVIFVAGARPNFMKVAPIVRVANASTVIEPILVHTEQHYDTLMSEVFLRDLDLRKPDIRLQVGAGSHATQTARVLIRLEPQLIRLKPAAVVVVGDVNSTLAGALAAAKLNLPVVHVEAGLRSYDRTMPEEINRVATDSIADLLLAPSEDAVQNLKTEGHPDDRIKMVGNVMIDSLDAILPGAERSPILDVLRLTKGEYFLATLHRPSNVDVPQRLRRLLSILMNAASRKPVVFVVHPRTAARLRPEDRRQLEERGVLVLEPTGYVDHIALLASSAAVLTDSGGMQEETTVLGVPCLTLRPVTERPVTVSAGTNHIVDDDQGVASRILDDICARARPVPNRPPLWDGHTAERIVPLLEDRYA